MITISDDVGTSCSSGDCILPHQSSCCLFFFLFGSSNKPPLWSVSDASGSISQRAQGDPSGTEWTTADAGLPKRSSVSSMLMAFFFKPLSLKSRSPTESRMKVLGGDNVLDHVLSSDEHKGWTNPPAAYALFWEHSETCSAQCPRGPSWDKLQLSQ